MKKVKKKKYEKLQKKNHKKRNPTDQIFLKDLRIDKKIQKDLRIDRKFQKAWHPKIKPLIFYTIYYLGDDTEEYIGYASIKVGERNITNVVIEPEYRNKGVATYLYDYIEKDLGIELQPSGKKYMGEWQRTEKGYLEPDGIGFWEARIKDENWLHWDNDQEERSKSLNNKKRLLKFKDSSNSLRTSMKSKLHNPNKSNRNPKQKPRLSKNPKNPYIKDLKKVIEFQKQLDTYNVRNQFPDIKEWVAINWKADEGTYDIYKLLYITIQKRIAEYNKENLFIMGNLNQKYDEAWGKFFELVRKLSDQYGRIDLNDLVTGAG